MDRTKTNRFISRQRLASLTLLRGYGIIRKQLFSLFTLNCGMKREIVISSKLTRIRNLIQSISTGVNYMDINECKKTIAKLSDKYRCSFDFKRRIILEKVHDSYTEVLHIPQEIQVLADGSLSNLASLTKIVFPKGLIFIGKNVFSGCKKLQQIVFPEIDLTKYYGAISAERKTWSYIPEDSFAYCLSLQSVVIPNNCTFIGARAFYNCTSLHSVVVPNGVEQICRNAFEGCTSLENITIPDSITEIQEKAFYNTAIKVIEIPESLKKIGQNAFPDDCEIRRVKKGEPRTGYKREATLVQKNKSNPTRNTEQQTPQSIKTASSIVKNSDTIKSHPGFSIENFLYEKANDGRICIIGIKNAAISTFPTYTDINSKNNAQSYVVLEFPEGITEIAENAFKPTPILDLLPVPKDELKRSKFLKKIVELKLPIGLKKIGASAFNFCENLSILTIPESVEEIGAWAFCNTALKCVVLPSGLKKIGEYAFPKECKILKLK